MFLAMVSIEPPHILFRLQEIAKQRSPKSDQYEKSRNENCIQIDNLALLCNLKITVMYNISPAVEIIQRRSYIL